MIARDHILKEVLIMLEGLENAHQVWNSLEEMLLSITTENKIHTNESLHTLKKELLTMEEYIKCFKILSDKLVAMKKPLDDLTKVFMLVRGLGDEYKHFKITMLAKAPYPTFNKFILALKVHEQMNNLEAEERSVAINHNLAFYSQRGRSCGRGRIFTP